MIKGGAGGKGGTKGKAREGQGSLLKETLVPPSASDTSTVTSDTSTVTILGQAPCNSPNWSPCPFSHPTLQIHSPHCSRGGLLKIQNGALSCSKPFDSTETTVLHHLPHAHFSPLSSPPFPRPSGPSTTLISQFLKQNELSSATRSLLTPFFLPVILLLPLY